MNKIEEFVRGIFADDIISCEEAGIDDDYISLCPNMETGSWLLIYEYYTGIRYVNNSPKGSGSSQSIKLSSFLVLFSEVIDSDKSEEMILNDLINYSEEEKLGYSWYFRLRLDKIQYGNFVDIRKIFADLYSKYIMRDDEGNPVSDYKKKLDDIITANKRFSAFMKNEKQKELIEDQKYKKQFFKFNPWS